MSAPMDKNGVQPYPTQPYPSQPYPTLSQPYPSASDFAANQNAYNPPAYNAPSYPPPQGNMGTPEAPPPAYGVGSSAFASPSVAVVNVADDSSLKDTDGMFSFNEKSVRLGFIRKVYGILALQMAVTVGLSCLFMFHEPTKLFVQNHIAVYATAYALFFVLYFVLVCCTSVARNYPCNMVLLGIFTISLAYMVAAITSFHDTKIVLMVFGITLIVCTAVMLFACQTKYDFTTCSGLLFVLTLSLLLFGIFAGIFVPTGSIKIVQMVYAGLGALLFMGFLAFDTQMIMGGRKYEISPEDYVFAAMMLYVDIIYIFLFLLSLFGGKS